MTIITNKQLATKLTAKYAKEFKAVKARTFGLTKKDIGSTEWNFRRLITNIMVSGSLESNVILAAREIFELYPTAQELAEADLAVLIEIMNENKVRFSHRKAGHVIDAAHIIVIKHGGEVPTSRHDLEVLPGVGRHTASTVRALAFNMPDFGVDLHVRRIAKRLQLVDEKANDISIEKTLSKGIAPEDLAAYSRAFVEFGKETCAKEPDCANCFLKSKCPVGTGVQTPTVSRNIEYRELEAGNYAIVAGSSDKEYTVTVSTSGSPRCNCKGYRFKRTCSHVKAVVEMA